MLSDILEIGDVVVITIPDENRSWGYNPCPDGTEATVIGFSEISYGRINNFGHKPGVYKNKSWVSVKHSETDMDISSCFLEMKDQEKCEKLSNAFHKQTDSDRQSHIDDNFLRELPKTPFWEGDTVIWNTGSCEQCHWDQFSLVVVDIDYQFLLRKTDSRNKRPVYYQLSNAFHAGRYTTERESNLKLGNRGNVWKYFHNDELKFEDLKEEANFFMMLGDVKEVRNPETNVFSWTKESALEAIKNGIAHGFTLCSTFFGPTSRISVWRFNNEELGKRVAQATLEGFYIL